MFLQTYCSVPQTALVPLFTGRTGTELNFLHWSFRPGISQTEPKMPPKGLMEQDLSKLVVAQLHPLAPEVISRQATINIGMAYAVF
jgi:hypothetical protein